jgi:hypothetical protein
MYEENQRFEVFVHLVGGGGQRGRDDCESPRRSGVITEIYGEFVKQESKR